MDIDKSIDRIRHQQKLLKLTSVENAIQSSMQNLVRYLDGKTTKTEVVNQLKEIGTPDALKVVDAVNQLHSTIKAHKETDLTEVTSLLKQLVDKEDPEINIPEAPESVKVSNLAEIDFSSLEKAVKNIKLDPKIDVKSPVVNVNTDLRPLQTSILQVLTAIQKLEFPEVPVTDLTKLETEAQQTNKHLEEHTKKLQKLIEKPMGGGGGGGNGTPYVDNNGVPKNVELDSNNNIPTTDVLYAAQIDSSVTNTLYVGKALPGSDTSSPIWQIAKIDTSSGLAKTWADGDSQFNNVWDDRTSLTYS